MGSWRYSNSIDGVSKLDSDNCIDAKDKEGSFYTSRIYDASGDNGRDIDNAARILFENPEFGDKVITHRFPLDAAEEAFKIADDRKSGSIKVVFDINV